MARWTLSQSSKLKKVLTWT